MNVGDSVTKNYTGNIQTFVVPNTGLYQLEVWGAKGGDLNNSEVGNFVGGKGGYAKGTVKLSRGTTLYIGCGGSDRNYYNGGGVGGAIAGGSVQGAWVYGANGGGATHIATSNHGVLRNYSSYQNDVIIVAGGGSGAYVNDDPSVGSADWGRNGSAGGDQSASGTFGQGEDWRAYNYSASGGGWFGGKQGKGGSSYVRSDMTDTTLTSGTNNGSGIAKITLLKKIGIKWGTKDATPKFGDKEIVAVYYGEQVIG